MPPINIQLEPSPLTEPTLSRHPDLRKIQNDVIAKLRYSLTAVAAEDQPGHPGRVDDAFRAYLASRSAPVRARFKERARAIVTSPLHAAFFGRYAAITENDYRTIGFDGLSQRVGTMANAVNESALLKGVTNLRNGLGRVNMVPPDAQAGPPGPSADLTAGLKFKKMKLFITGVRCVEESDEVGSDEINLGGTSTNPRGTTSLINQWEVSDDFDQGELVSYGMTKVFTSWNLATETSGFPYVYGAVISMAEKDDGGFYAFLKALWENVDAEVKSAIKGAVGATIGAAIGGVIGNIGGAIVGAIIGAIIGWLVSLFENKDDIIGTKTVVMTLGACTKSYYDWAKLTTPQGYTHKLHYTGDGAYYRVALAYKVFT